MYRRFLVMFGATLALLAGPRDAQWKKVHDAMDKGLPKTAITELDPIVRQAMAAKAYGEAVKAISLRIVMEANIQGNKPEEKIVRMQAEVAKAPEVVKPVMESILANWYWQYFQQNRWRYLQRTRTADAPGADFRTWDLPRILAEVDRHFTLALSYEKQLKATPVSEYDELLTTGTVPDVYRPTMFDFLAQDALAFYAAGEQGVMKAEDAFELLADSPVLSSSEAFLAWKPVTQDPMAPAYKAVRLYQELLAFHRGDHDRTAFADVDLQRLAYAYNHAVGETKKSRYKLALKHFVDAWGSHEVTARALAAWAGVLQGEHDLAAAHALAARGYRDFPRTAGGAMCFNILGQIEAKSASLETERVWNDPWPTLDVTYRNVTKVYFRAVAVDYEARIKTQKWGVPGFDPDRDRALVEGPSALAWSAELPPTADYRERIERIPAPKDLKPGFYYIFASHDPAFRRVENLISYAPVWVSKLALVVRQRNLEGGLDGFVLDARSGAPVSGAMVSTLEKDRKEVMQRTRTTRTDANGMFRIAKTREAYSSLVLLAEHGGECVSTLSEVGIGTPNNPDERTSQTVFFTDRSLYRPGQTISYKGICFQADQAKADYRVLPGQTLTVLLLDANGKEVERHTHTCNDQGSFSGWFTAPRDRATGRMAIQAQGIPGSTGIRVEEYKRPKFQVELAAPKEPARLHGEVRLTGKATAYTGAALGGAKVSWRVERAVQLPPWCWWGARYWSGRHQASQAMAHGTALTESDGSFKISFTAQPDLAIAEQDEPVFTYTVHADVTDTTGETRSEATSIQVGYRALKATLTLGGWQTVQKPVDLTLRTATLDGQPLAAEGTLAIHALKQPQQVQRPSLGQEDRWLDSTPGEPALGKADPANPESWELGERVHAQDFRTAAGGEQKVQVRLEAGLYRALLRTQDRFGKPVTARLTFLVLDPKAGRHAVKWANFFDAPQWSVEPGSTFQALWGTGYEQGRAFVELECHGKLLQSYWTAPWTTQVRIEQAIREDMRGGLTVRATFIRENRAYFNERVVDVPWSNKQLSVKWEHFTSKLAPGQKETWTAVITAPDARKAAAEMVAGLYDASLDPLLTHDWMTRFDCFRQEFPQVEATFQNQSVEFQHLFGDWSQQSKNFMWNYRSYMPEIQHGLGGYGFGVAGGVTGSARSRGSAAKAAYATVEVVAATAAQDKTVAFTSAGLVMSREPVPVPPPPPPPPPAPDLSKVTARKNLNETAFFFPHLLAGEDGVVRMQFTMPEALTEWKFLGFAHDRELRSGSLTGRTVTAKDLMVQPNPPRFVREGDVLEFTVKVSNQSEARQAGQVRVNFADARTGESRDAQVGNTQAVDQAFDIPAKESRSFSWRVAIPDGCEFLTYKAVGATAALSDGEEGFLPVLSRRILVTESLPLAIRGKQEKTVDFTRLLASGASTTLRQESLSLQVVSQPAWYAVMALPYLMEFPYECSEQVFNRLYGNALARHIANRDPKIRRVFDQWRGTPALDSPLEKNQDLKAVLLEETPWVRQAQAESQARRNVGLLFDANRLDEETQRTLQKLTDMQLADGRWPWFPGGRPSDYITLYVVTGFGRLRRMGVDVDVTAATKALNALDAWMNERYGRIKFRDTYVPGSLDALYLYGRSFFLKDRAIAKQHRAAVDFFLGRARAAWLKVNDRQSQAHLAIALARFGAAGGNQDPTPQDILRSIKERSVSSEELGMFWREQELSWWWYRAPIETQAVMVEAFDEVMGDRQAVEDCQVWLLKQKQTQDWKTTKATADAIYALLLKGSDKLASDALVDVSLGGQPVKPDQVEAGTGFYEKRFVKGEIKPELGHVTLKKVDDGVSWGSLNWQYLEDMTKVTAYAGTPLKLKKALFVKDTTAKGQVLRPVTGPLAVGDELVVRVELRVDRDMEYVHLKDQRGSGTEPVDVLSGYRYRDGLAYYQSTRDTASHFFIDYLPKGTYVFEYSVRVQLKGRYQTGVASIQCMYAPEFNSHSESFELEVR